MRIILSRLHIVCTFSLFAYISNGQTSLTQNGATRATDYLMQNKIVTISRDSKSFSYVAYLENTGQISPVGSKKYKVFIHEIENSEVGFTLINKIEVGETWEKFLDGEIFPEPHGSPSITIDKNGILHVVFGPHYDFIQYRKSTGNLFQNSLLVSSNPDIPSLKSTDSHTIDRWTYPIIKTDSNGVLHVGGSLDSRYTLDDYGNDEHYAKEFGYVRNLNNDPSSPWQLPMQRLDPLYQHLAPEYLCRYDAMMNIDNNNIIHILAPDQYPYLPNEGYLDYYYFKSTSGGNSFVKIGKVYSNDRLLNEEGWGNIAFDAHNNPHFLVSASDFNSPRSRWLKYIYYDGINWITTPLFVDNLNIHQAKLRIDKDDVVNIVLQASAYNGWTGDPSKIIMLSKRPGEAFVTTTIREGGLLYWIPSIEEEEKFTIDKNWFYVIWQESNLADNPQAVELVKVVPYTTSVNNRTFSKYGEYFTANLLEVGPAVQIKSTANMILKSKTKTVLKPGFTVKKGAHLTISVNSQICNSNVCLSGTSGNSLGRIGNGKIPDHSTTQILANQEFIPITIFPNPSAGKFLIQRTKTEDESRIEVFNVLGQKILTKKLPRGDFKTEIDISDQPNGVFLLKITGLKESEKAFRLIKN
jgi:hypothetical protein